MSTDQQEFLFADNSAHAGEGTWADDPLLSDIATTWALPIGKKVRVHLKEGENLSWIDGRLELATAPDLPLDSRQPLRLRIKGYAFSSRSITGWAAQE